MLKGQCLCGAIEYRYSGELDDVVICHCNECKRAQGGPFAANAVINSSQFSFISGEADLIHYASSPNKRRCFCSSCGSPIYSYRLDLVGVLRLRLGSITSGEIPKPSQQQFLESASKWCQL